jgi:hypothetical protein
VLEITQTIKTGADFEDHGDKTLPRVYLWIVRILPVKCLSRIGDMEICHTGCRGRLPALPLGLPNIGAWPHSFCGRPTSFAITLSGLQCSVSPICGRFLAPSMRTFLNLRLLPPCPPSRASPKQVFHASRLA